MHSSLWLSVPYRAGTRDLTYVCGLLQWVRAHHARGNFRRVKNLTMETKEEAVSDTFCCFSAAVLMLADTWQLQRVHVSGPFDWDLVVGLLPASATHLELLPSPWALPKVVDLASFCKFTALQTLSIYPLGHDPDYEHGNSFLLSATLTSLVSVTLSNWPFKLANGCSVAVCLPSLVHASVHLYLDLVNAFTLLDRCKVLYLILLDPTPLPIENSMEIRVESSSQLRRLSLCGELVSEVDLVVTKPGVQLFCLINCNCVEVASFDKYETQNFQELHWQ